MKVFTRYLLLQIPGALAIVLVMVVLHLWLEVPLWIGVAVVAGWLAKDLALYPLVRSAYDVSDASSPQARLVGARGVAEQDLAPTGFVRVRGELWRAVAAQEEAPIRRGEAVRVRAVDGLELVVSR